MKQLSKEEILKYFDKINSKLAANNKTGEIIIAGGAAMTLVYGTRNSTMDVDAIYAPKTDINRIVKSIAQEENINDDWLNDGVKAFFTEKMTSSEILKYSHLQVNSIDADCLLAMKLSSARTLTKDLDDSIVLMSYLNITNNEQLFELLEKFIPEKRLTAQVNFFALQAFEIYYQKKTEKQNDYSREALVRQKLLELGKDKDVAEKDAELLIPIAENKLAVAASNTALPISSAVHEPPPKQAAAEKMPQAQAPQKKK